MTFINIMSKSYYDANHKAIVMKIESMTYLQLFHRYIISDLTNKKLLNQWVGLFHILECIKYLIYHLELLFTMQIHFVVLIAQLESVFKNNSYNYQSSTNSLSVQNNNIVTDEITNNNVEMTSSYKIKCLLDKCIIYWECDQFMMKYLVKWKEYNHSHNVWYKVKELNNTTDLVKNFEHCHQT